MCHQVQTAPSHTPQWWHCSQVITLLGPLVQALYETSRLSVPLKWMEMTWKPAAWKDRWSIYRAMARNAGGSPWPSFSLVSNSFDIIVEHRQHLQSWMARASNFWLTGWDWDHIWEPQNQLWLVHGNSRPQSRGAVCEANATDRSQKSRLWNIKRLGK